MRFPFPRKADPDARRAKAHKRTWRLLPWVALGLLTAAWPTPARGEEELSEANADRLQPGHGRHARSPAQIPLKGWKDIVWRTWQEANTDRITRLAAGVTFFGLLALFPGLAAFVSLYGLFADVHTAQGQLAVLAGVIPADALTFIGKQMLRIAKARDTSLGLAFAVSLLLSLWSANAGMKAMFDALNIAYGEREKRTYVRLTVVTLLFTLGALVFMLVATGALVIAPPILDYLGLRDDLLSFIRWPVLLVVMMFGLAVVYRYGPSREHARWRWVSWGGVLAAVLWLAASLAFSAYMSNFAHYDRTYGALGAVVGAMTWMWLTAIIVLLGAELNAEIEHQTVVDSTTGRPLPMGARGAEMADTVGIAAGRAKRRPERKSMAKRRGT
jgi:membrane protein